MSIYLARYSLGEVGFLTAAFRWQISEGTLAPASWSRLLLGQRQVDLGVRIVAEPGAAHALLLLTVDSTAETELKSLCHELCQLDKPYGLTIPSTAEDFDSLTGPLPCHQIRINYDGYHYEGKPLACDFRLYSAFASRVTAERVVYQVHLRPYFPRKETERAARKYVVWLDVEEPFSVPVRSMQGTLAQRLLQRGWTAAEYLCFDDARSLEDWLDRIRNAFRETTGRLGFAEPPVEIGDFSDWLTTGCHPLRAFEEPPSLQSLGASVFSQQETALLFSFQPVLSRKPDSSTSDTADVFISYASADSMHAFAACNLLEENGFNCWIAPRDINNGTLPWPEAIVHGLSLARVVVVFLSDAASVSVHIPRELAIAIDRRLPVVPVLLEEMALKGQLQYLLSTCQCLNAHGRDFSYAIAELVTRVRRFIG